MCLAVITITYERLEGLKRKKNVYFRVETAEFANPLRRTRGLLVEKLCVGALLLCHAYLQERSPKTGFRSLKETVVTCKMMMMMIYLLTAIGSSPGGRSTVHIYTQAIHRTIQNKQHIEQHNNFERVRAVPHLG